MKHRKFFVPAIVSVLTLSLYASSSTGYAATPKGFKISGDSPIAARHGKILGHTSRSTNVTVTIGLKLKNNNDLDGFIDSLNDPASPNYKHYLSPKEFKARFGPTNSTVESVKNFLMSKGLTIKSVGAANAFITASGSTGELENAFGITINNYKNSRGQTYFANEQAPTIPAALSGVITDVTGLNNEAHYTFPKICKPTSLQSKPAAAAKMGSGPAGGYTPAELKGAYDINPLASTGFTGTGQNVALVELDGYQASNITRYDNYYSLGSPAPANIYVDGFKGTSGLGESEAELDIELVNAIAPKAQAIVYEGPNTDQGLIDTYQKIASDNKAKSISVSWGIGEQQESTSMMNSLHSIFQEYAAQGQSIFAASGDNGAYDSGDGTLSVDSPANDPYVTGVGGTSLTLNGSAYSSESAWRNNIDGQGGGGGLSANFTMPTYQSGPGVQNSYTNGKREVPDVSADADPNTGYSIYSEGLWTQVGGTSGAAPIWAAVTALNNQYALANKKETLGQANPKLYNLFNKTQPYKAFHDITSGNNLYYPAMAGYDMATGIGTPDVYNLIRDLNSSSSLSGGTGSNFTELIKNGGFEGGQSSWIELSTKHYQLIATGKPHSGSYSASLGKYNQSTDLIYQTVTIPAKATSALLTFWTDVSTAETKHPYDFFYMQVRNTKGTVLSTMLTLQDGSASVWSKHSFSLINYKGQTIQLAFKGTNDYSNPTHFYVDDISLQVN